MGECCRYRPNTELAIVGAPSYLLGLDSTLGESFPPIHSLYGLIAVESRQFFRWALI